MTTSGGPSPRFDDHHGYGHDDHHGYDDHHDDDHGGYGHDDDHHDHGGYGKEHGLVTKKRPIVNVIAKIRNVMDIIAKKN